MALPEPSCPCSSKIFAPLREGVHDRLALHFAAFHVVGADVIEDALDAAGRPIDGDDRDAGGDRLGEHRRQRVDVARRDEDGVDLLGDRALDVGGLLRAPHSGRPGRSA